MAKRAWLNLLLIGMAVSLTVTNFKSTADGNTSQQNATPKTQIVLLGTGTPNADPERFGPSVAIVVNDTPYIFDSGPGVVRRAAAAFKKGVRGLEAKNLKTVFITHLHSDHTVGLPDLIFTPWVLERTEPLAVYGPRGIRAMVAHLMAAYQEDIDMRLNGLEPANRTGYRAVAHEIKPGVVYKDRNVTVKAFSVRHGSWKQAFGYCIETQDRTIVISGDCTFSPEIIENCNGCDVLIHEVYSQRGFATRPVEWQKYHSQFHTSTSQLGEIAARARPGLLVLYHQLFWGRPEEEAISEIKEVFKGKVVSGRDLDIY
ncbi:MAG: MBL fold metallo-hydrolase [Acidobacteriota bacterium]